jgi:hypothetical protein
VQVRVDVVFISFMLRFCNHGDEMYNGFSGIDITWRLSADGELDAKVEAAAFENAGGAG